MSGFSTIDPALKKRIKELSLEYTDKPQPELLIPVPNPHPGIDYEEKLEYPEFTSLCPLAASQPDYATITIRYKPKEFIAELKSLKLYLVSFRNVKIFHEAVVGEILKDLVACCQPEFMTVEGVFTVRGGITTTITADYFSPES